MKNLIRYLTSKNVGYAAVGYAGVSYILATLGLIRDLQSNWQTTLVGIAAVGGVLLYWAKNPDKAWFKLPGDGMPEPEAVSVPVTSKSKVGISEDDFKDFAAIDHLTDRFVESNNIDGVKLCKDLQSKLFDIHHKVEVPTQVIANPEV